MISEKDIDNIRNSWEFIMEDELRNMLKFYTRLFEIAPEVRIYFPDDMSKLAEKLGYVLKLLVSNLENFDNLKPKLVELGTFHYEQGIEKYHYKYVIQALGFTIKEAMGYEYTEEIGNSWKKVLIAVSSIMISAPEKREKGFKSLLKKLFG